MSAPILDRTVADTTASPETQPARAASAGKPARTTRGRVASALLGVLMTAMLALAVVAVVVPKMLGAIPLTVLTGSMEPALSPGDVVVVRPVDAQDVRMGDVVTFQPVSDDPTLVTHRVVGVQRGTDGVAGFITRGDANGADDDPIVPGQLMGRVVYSIPFIGHVTNASWGSTVVTVGGVGLVLYAVVAIVTPDRSRRRRNA